MNTTQCRRAGRAAMSHGWRPRFVLLSLAAAILASTPAAGQMEDIFGRWDVPDTGPIWPLMAQHSIHLSTGKVLVFKNPNTDDPALWDPIADTFTLVPTRAVSPGM